MKYLKLMLVLWLAVGLILMAAAPLKAGRGSYQAVHGPTTVFHAVRIAKRLLALLIGFALLLIGRLARVRGGKLSPAPAVLLVPLLC
jgi:hypothetical protein